MHVLLVMLLAAPPQGLEGCEPLKTIVPGTVGTVCKEMTLIVSDAPALGPDDTMDLLHGLLSGLAAGGTLKADPPEERSLWVAGEDRLALRSVLRNGNKPVLEALAVAAPPVEGRTGIRAVLCERDPGAPAAKKSKPNDFARQCATRVEAAQKLPPLTAKNAAPVVAGKPLPTPPGCTAESGTIICGDTMLVVSTPPGDPDTAVSAIASAMRAGLEKRGYTSTSEPAACTPVAGTAECSLLTLARGPDHAVMLLAVLTGAGPTTLIQCTLPQDPRGKPVPTPCDLVFSSVDKKERAGVRKTR